MPIYNSVLMSLLQLHTISNHPIKLQQRLSRRPSMDCTEAIDRLEGKSSPKPTLQELAAMETKCRVSRVLQMRIEGGTAPGISCPTPRTDGPADYLNSPQPLQREFCLQYYRSFANGKPVSEFYCKICNSELGDLPPSTCDMCRRHGRLARPTSGTAFERVNMSRIEVGLITVAEYRLREISDLSKSRWSRR